MEYIVKGRCQTSGSYTNTIYVAGSFVVNGDLAIGKEHITGGGGRQTESCLYFYELPLNEVLT